MKKTLIALATLAACGASFAQSTVTISGVLDAGYRTVNAPLGGKTSGGFQNGTATSAILIQGTEEISKGLTGSFRYEINPDFVGGAGFSGTVLNSAGMQTSNGANGYHFVAVTSDDVGSIRFGRLNSPSLGAWGVASVFGTALGSGYGANGNIFTGTTSSVANYNQTAPTRFNGAVEYQTPSLGGLSARFLMVPKVDNSGIGNVDGASVATMAGANRASVTDLSLAFSQGPLNVMAAKQTHKYGNNLDAVAPTTVSVAALVAPGNSSNVPGGSYALTTLAANYKMGDATIYAARWTEKQATVAATALKVDSTGTMLGAKYAMGAVTLMASMGTRDDKSTVSVGTNAAGADKKITGLGVDYALGKRTNLWARYENRDSDTTRSGVSTLNPKASWDAIKTTAVGIRATF